MDQITPENVLEKLKLHRHEETPAVCLIAGQEIERLRKEVAEHERAWELATKLTNDVNATTDRTLANMDEIKQRIAALSAELRALREENERLQKDNQVLVRELRTARFLLAKETE